MSVAKFGNCGNRYIYIAQSDIFVCIYAHNTYDCTPSSRLSMLLTRLNKISPDTIPSEKATPAIGKHEIVSETETDSYMNRIPYVHDS